MSETASDNLREAAKKSLKKKADFRQYLWVWLFVSVLLTVIWWFTPESEFYWPIFAIGGMGIGAFFTALDAYSKSFNKVITEADIQAEIKKLSS